MIWEAVPGILGTGLGGCGVARDGMAMDLALELARKGLGLTSPNPPVGAVVVREGQVVGTGWHRRAGTEHAEVLALREAGEKSRGADLYVTLEPCNHQGRTPPCTGAILAAEINRVVVAVVDPNPKVCGSGILTLAKAGVMVEVGLGGDCAEDLYRPFKKYITKGVSYLTLKAAATLDGKVATKVGDSRWVTSAPARRLVHQMRGQCDGLVTGIGTVLRDDPRLTVRPHRGRNPLRFILDSQGRIPPGSRCLQGEGAVVVTIQGAAKSLEDRGVQVWLAPPGADGKIDLGWFLRETAKHGLVSLMSEAGGTLNAAFMKQGLVDRYQLFLAPKFLGGDGLGLFAGEGPGLMADAFPLRIIGWERIGEDFLLTAEGA